MEDLIRAFLALGGILALILVLFWASKWLSKRSGAGFGGMGNIQLLDRMPLGQDKAIALICVCGKYLLVGITSGGIHTLYELSDEEAAEVAVKRSQGSAAGFLTQLKTAMAKRGSAPKEVLEDEESGGFDDKA